MQGHPLGAKGGVPAEITQPEYVVYRQWIDSHPVELPGITEIDVLSDLYGIENKQRAIITCADQYAAVLDGAAFEKSAASKEIQNKPSFFGDHIITGVHPGIRPV